MLANNFQGYESIQTQKLQVVLPKSFNIVLANYDFYCKELIFLGGSIFTESALLGYVFRRKCSWMEGESNYYDTKQFCNAENILNKQ